MSGECSKCGEHCLDCECHDEAIFGAAASLLASNLMETQLNLSLNTIKQANLWNEFEVFLNARKHQIIWDTINQFCSQYPDIFYICEDKS